MASAVEPQKQEADVVEQVEMAEKGQEPILPPTDAEVKALYRKLDWNLMPMIWIIYMLSVLDRTNLGNAHIAGLDKSIGLVGTQYNLLGTIFYVGYALFQWTAVGWKQFPAHIWVACVVLAWSSISTLQASVSSFGGLLALRLLLGATEAMYAGLPVYLSFFYPRDKVGFRQGIFLSGSALANAYGGALGYACLLIKSHLESWRILFLVEGLPTLIMVGVAYFFFPDGLNECKFLNDREKEIAVHMISQGQVADTERHQGVRIKEWLAAFTDWRSYVPGIMYFGCNVSFSSLPLFVPTIIAEIGTFSTVQSNGLSAPPYLLTFILILICSFASDRLRLRGPFVCFFGLVASVGFILLATTTGPVPRYLGIYLAITIFIPIAILLPWVSNVHSTESKRAGGWAIFATMGQCGPFLGTNLFPADEGPYYRKGSLISMTMCLLVSLGGALFSFLLWRENKKLDRLFEEGAVEDDTDRLRTPRGFRYMI